MFRRILTSLLWIGILPITVFSQQQKGYEITGYINGLQEGEKVTAFLLYDGSPDIDRRDSAYVKNGVFHLNGVVPDGPREYMLTFASHNPKLHVDINNGEHAVVRCTRNIDSVEHTFIDNFTYIEGAKFDASLTALLPAYHLYRRSTIDLEKFANKIVDSIGFDGPVLDGIFGSIEQVNKALTTEIFTSHPNQVRNPATLAAQLFLIVGIIERSGHASFLVNRYNTLTEDEKNSYYGKILKTYIPLCVGQPFPEFVLPAADGKPLALKDIVAKSKVTLVHFWSADSYKRKQYQDELRALYKKYHDKGLNVIGVSSDRYGEQWRENLQKEQFPWSNVADLRKREESMIDKVYHEYSPDDNPDIHNTTNVLIDAQGKILAWDINGVKLQWLLWKNCKE